jgi:hypothetical protein
MKTTIDIAREADLIDDTYASDWYVYQLQRLEALVRADERNRTWTQEHWTDYERSIAAQEREACAKVCDVFYCDYCADAIRNRGQA